MKRLLLLLALGGGLWAQPKAADGYLYVSGQPDKTAGGKSTASFEAQAHTALDNVKRVVEAAGLTMDHVVYTHVYLEDMSKRPELDRAFARYFPTDPPARSLIGVASLSGGQLEIGAVAVVDRRGKTPVRVAGFGENPAFSAGMLTHDRLFISSLPGRGADGGIPVDPAAEVTAALDSFQAVTEAAGLTLAHVVFVNPFLTRAIPAGVMNKLYAQRFEFGNTPARATISVTSLASGNITYTGVAVRDLARRKAVRPRNMPPSPTASPCVFAGSTLYCSAKSGFIPGPQSGIYAATVEHQLRQTMRNQLDNFEEAGLNFSHVVSSVAYMDDIADWAKLSAIYGQYFTGAVKPVETILQQVAPGNRQAGANGRYPTLEQISFIAVRPERQ